MLIWEIFASRFWGGFSYYLKLLLTTFIFVWKCIFWHIIFLNIFIQMRLCFKITSEYTYLKHRHTHLYPSHTSQSHWILCVLAYSPRWVISALWPQLSLSFPGKALKQLTNSFYLSVITKCPVMLKLINILLLKTTYLLLFLLPPLW